MKMKSIMLITFLLLAVLTIGAASASDDIASDGLNATDDSDVITADDDYDEDEHYIEINEDEIDIGDETEDIATIYLPENKKGNFKILNGENVVANLEVDVNDDDHWDEDDGILEGTIYLEDFDLEKVHDGDTLSFLFFEKNSQTPVDFFTKTCKVSIIDSTMKLTEIHGGMTEDDVEIQVNDIDTSKPDENFTYVNVTQKAGIFIINVEGKDDYMDIFKEDLSSTKRQPVEFDDENGTHIYSFGFSYTDLNNYIAKHVVGGDTFIDLINMNIIDGNDISFGLYGDDEGDDEIYCEEMTFTLRPDGWITFDDEEGPVDVECIISEIIMYEGWNETEVLRYEIIKGINGNIVIYLNDNETPAFNKTLSELEPVDPDDEAEENEYIITVSDLNIKQAGEYLLRYYFDDDKGNHIYSYDSEDPDILVLYEPQIITVDNITIEVNPIPATVGSNATLIRINDTDAKEEDKVFIYVDGNETPITIKIGECKKDEDGKYNITADKLNLGVGEHSLNITYKGVNLTSKVNITTDIIIELPDEDETVYTTFNDAFVWISLEEREIYENIEGEINLTIMDKDGNIIDTLQKDIRDLKYEGKAYVIRTNDIKSELNGTYSVVATYLFKDKVIVQEKDNATFKTFDPEDYGTTIKDLLDGETKYLISFDHIPSSHTIAVVIDGTKTVELDKTDLKTGIDQGKQIYYIPNEKLGNLEDGFHTARVCIVANKELIDLASGSFIVDKQENFDLGLTITVADIEEGNVAKVVIKTNSTFTGEVMVQVANKNYTVNVTKGEGNLEIKGLSANTYTATALFKSDGIFNDSTKTTTFKVTSKPTEQAKKSKTTVLTLKKVKVKKSAKKLVLKATLKINGKAAKGKKITFKFKGKKYTAKTNKKGVAKVTIKKKVLKKLKVGKKVKIQASYGKTVKKLTVKVKK